MIRTGPYGSAWGDVFGLDEAPAMQVRVLRKADVYATEIRLPDQPIAARIPTS